LFRLGEARLGQDSLLGLGGRDPALLPAAVLGQTYLAESRLTPGHPFDVKERQVVGRDPVVSRTKSSELRHRDAGNRNRGE